MSGATTGKTADNRTGRALLLNQRVGRIEIFLMDDAFMGIFLDTLVAKFLSISAGTAIPILSSQQINETLVAVPPLPEQRRIAAKVQELFMLCNRLESALIARDKQRCRLLDALIAETLDPSNAPEPVEA